MWAKSQADLSGRGGLLHLSGARAGHVLHNQLAGQGLDVGVAVVGGRGAVTHNDDAGGGHGPAHVQGVGGVHINDGGGDHHHRSNQHQQQNQRCRHHREERDQQGRDGGWGHPDPASHGEHAGHAQGGAGGQIDHVAAPHGEVAGDGHIPGDVIYRKPQTNRPGYDPVVTGESIDPNSDLTPRHSQNDG